MVAVPKSYTDFLKAHPEVSAAVAAPTPKKLDLSKMGSGGGASSGGDNHSFLSWLTDIISRPLYGVEDNINALGKAQAKEQGYQQKHGVDFFHILGYQVATQNPITQSGNFLRGVFSDASGDHITTAQNEEQLTDAFGKNDPNYKDVKDNVNPVLKGVTGLAGDIALDPLTYVPGLDILGAGLKIYKGVKAGTGAAEIGSQVAERLLTKTGTRVAKAAINKVKPKTPSEAVLNGITPLAPAIDAAVLKPFSVVGHNGTEAFSHDFDSLEEAKAFLKQNAPKNGLGKTPKSSYKLVDNTFEATKAAKAAAKTVAKVPVIDRPVDETGLPATVGEQMRANPRSKAMAAILTDLGRTKKQRPVTLPSPETGAPGGALDSVPWLKEHIALATASPKHSSNMIVKVSNIRQSIPLTDVPSILARRADTPLKAAVQDAVLKRYTAYRDAFKLASNAKKPMAVDALLRPIEPAKLPNPGAPLPSETLTSQLARFHELHAQNQAKVEQALGVGLTAQLKSIQRPEKFDAVIKSLSDVLARTDDLTDVTSFAGNPAMGKLFRTLGIDPIKVNAALRQAESAVGKDAPVDPIFDKIRDPKLGAELSQGDRDVAAAIPAAIKKNFLDTEDYVYHSKRGVANTEEGIGKGLGNDEHAINTHKQWDILHALTDLVTERVKTVAKSVGAHPGLFGRDRARVVAGEVIPLVERAEQLLDSRGMPLFLDSPAANGEQLLLSLGQSLRVLSDGNYGSAIADTMFNGPGSLPTTNFADAVFMAVKKGASWEDVDAQLAKATKRSGKEGDIPNPLSDGKEVYLGGIPARTGVKKPQSQWITDPHTGEKVLAYRYVLNDAKTQWKKMYQSAPLRQSLTEAIMANVGRFSEVAAENVKAFQARSAAETFDLVDKQIEELTNWVDDPTRLADALGGLASIPQRIARDAADGGALVPSAEKASIVVENAAPEGAVDAAKSITKAAKAKATAGKAGKTDEEVVSAGQPHMAATALKDADEAVREAEDMATKEPPANDSIDWQGSSNEYHAAAGIQRGLLDPLKSGFSRQYRNDVATWSLMDYGLATLGRLSSDYRKELKGITQRFSGLVDGTSTPIITQAFQDAQHGVNRGGIVGEATQAIRASLGRLVDLDGENPLLNTGAFRMNTGLDHLNKRLRDMGLPEIDIDASKRAAKANETSVLEEASKQWKDWTITDPIDFMAKLQATMVRLATDHAVGMAWGRKAAEEGWSSRTWKPGFAKLNSVAGSAVADSLDRSLWYDKEMLGHLRQVDEIMHSSTKIGGQFGNFINKYLDPIQNAWKKMVTIWHVGHHTRNLTGDQSSTFLAEGVEGLQTSVKNALKVMHVHGNYSDLDVQAGLEHLGVTGLPRGTDVLLDGRFGKMTTDDLYAWAQEHGLLRNAQTIETLGDETTGAFANIANKLSLKGTKAESVVMGLSEAREHYSRIQHFLQIIQREQKKSGTASPKELNAMLEKAAYRVKRFHPDRSMLTSFEKKYMARLFPFYTWFRGMLPVIVESLAMHPGRVNAFNKASYNLAVANGIDPNSLSDPFPDDQLFPSFLTDQIGGGPVAKVAGNYFGVQPGLASQDVLNQFVGGNPISNALGMLSPLVKDPIELASGTNLATQSPINDYSDYIDSQIPGVNYAANFSGVSPSGSLVSSLQGKGLDPQYQVFKGNKSPTDLGISASNWLTGGGLQNMSRQNYINFAEIEKRNAAAAAANSSTQKNPF